jgi:hypothetical protein
MQFGFRSKYRTSTNASTQPAASLPALETWSELFRSVPRGKGPRTSAKRLRLESLESRAMLAAIPLVTATSQASTYSPPSDVAFDDLGQDWLAPDFDDTSWNTTPLGGVNGIGFDNNTPPSGYTQYLGYDTAGDMSSATPAAFVRYEFNVADKSAITALTLSMRFDDGFIAWLNGTEITRVNAPLDAYPKPRNIGSTTTVAVASASYTTYDATSVLSALQDGSNVLAIRGFNLSRSDKDFLIQAKLDGGTVERLPSATDDSAAMIDTEGFKVIDVLANDDPGTYGNGMLNKASVTIKQPPINGVATVNPIDGKITYTPNSTFAGTETFTYTVRDNFGAITTTSVVQPTTAPHKTLVPTNDALARTWTGGNEPFNDSTWLAGVGGVGYDHDTATNYLPQISDNVDARVYNINQSIYIRIPFTLDDPGAVSAMQLLMRYDDGFIAYINGVEVASANRPADPLFFSSGASGTHADAASLLQETFNVNLKGVPLRSGANANILAFQSMNSGVGSSDMIQQPELRVTTDSRHETNAATVSVTVTSTGPVAVADTGRSKLGEAVTIPVLANDSPGASPPLVLSTLKVSQDPLHGSTTVDPATGSIRYTPDAGFTGDDTFFYTIHDSNQAVFGTEQQTFVSTTTANRFTVPTDGTAALTWTQAAFNDSSWTAGSHGIGYDANTATVDYNPYIGTPTPAGATPVTVYGRWKFSVENPADVIGMVLTVRSDDGFVAYINGVQVAAVNAPAAPVFNSQAVVGGPADGTVIATPNVVSLNLATIALSPGNDNVLAIHGLNTGTTSSDMLQEPVLTATVTTERGKVSNPGQVTVHTNAPPTLNPDTVTIAPNAQPIVITPLVNDTDPDNSPGPGGKFGIDPATLEATTDPDPDSIVPRLTNNGDGTLTFNAAGIFQPRDLTFKYRVKDYEGRLSAEQTVTIHVVPNPPTAAADSAATPESVDVSIPVLANDVRGSDAAIDPSSVQIVAQPAHGSIVAIDSSTGAVTYRPNAGFRDQFDTFTYTVKDINGNASTPATVTVDVFSLAIAREDGYAIPTGSNELVIDIGNMILNNDYIPPKFEPAIVIVPGSAVGGTAVFDTDNGRPVVRFTKTAGAVGTGSFDYYIQDVVGNPTRPNSNTARVSIALQSVTISGEVYLDVNNNHTFDGATEKAISDVMITLTRPGDLTFKRTTTTGTNGMYSFASSAEGVLPAGTYTITETQPSMYLDFQTGRVNSYTVNLTAADNSGYDFREWTVNPAFFSVLATYGGGFTASQQPVSLSANSIVVPYDAGYSGAFSAKASYDPNAGPVTVKLYNAAGSVVANAATNPNSTPGSALVSYQGSANQGLVLVVSGTNPSVSISTPSLNTTGGDRLSPYVNDVNLSSSKWTSDFVNHLTTTHMGSAGYAVSATETLPWQNLDQVQIRFNEAVVVGPADLRLAGVAVGDYRTQIGIKAFHYDPFTFTATWTLNAPIGADQLRVGLSDAVRDVFGTAIGGSGYNMLFNVLPGDFSRGQSAHDSRELMANGFSSIGASNYSPFYDLDGNGKINVLDAILARNSAQTLLPAGTPGGTGSGSTGTGGTGGTGSGGSPQAPAAIVVATGRTSSSAASSSASSTAAHSALVARSVRSAAVDRILSDASNGATGTDSSGHSELSVLRARRTSRSVLRGENADSAF